MSVNPAVRPARALSAAVLSFLYATPSTNTIRCYLILHEPVEGTPARLTLSDSPLSGKVLFETDPAGSYEAAQQRARSSSAFWQRVKATQKRYPHVSAP